MGAFRVVFLCAMSCVCVWDVSSQAGASKIKIIHGGNFLQDEVKYPGAALFMSDNRQVNFSHEGVNVFCDMAVYYKKQNIVKARGNINLKQGDSIEMMSSYIKYEGNTRMAVSKGDVVLKTKTSTLTTDTLHFDRRKQEAYYNVGGKVVDSENVLKSKNGRYYLEDRKVRFDKDVSIINEKFKLTSTSLLYYPDTGDAYFYGATTIKGDGFKSYCERGRYETRRKRGVLLKGSWIEYDSRKIFADSIHFDRNRDYYSATTGIKVVDTINNVFLRGHYAEFFQNKEKRRDSIIVTQVPVMTYLKKKDSLHVHGDTLMIFGADKNRFAKVFHNVKIFGKGISGRCDSIHSIEHEGIMRMHKSPVVWSGKNQVTGDIIELESDKGTKKLDSIRIYENPFIAGLDTIGKEGYNQMKAKRLKGKFIDNELKIVKMLQDAEVMWYLYGEDGELVGIDKAISKDIEILFDKNKIYEITFLKNPEGDIFPEFELPENARKLKDFNWRGDEMIESKQNLFDGEDLNFVPKKITGFEGIDLDEEERHLRAEGS